jgi:hypothetical protein
MGEPKRRYRNGTCPLFAIHIFFFKQMSKTVKQNHGKDPRRVANNCFVFATLQIESSNYIENKL